MSPEFLKLVQHPVKFRLFLISKLPAAYFSGVRVRYLDADRSEVTIKYRWFATNPFRSIYFACLAMAAEMSTGVLAMGFLHAGETPVSMLITGMDAEFLKKATGRITFHCTDGARVAESIGQAVATGSGVEVKLFSEGKNEAGDTIARFSFTWSFKSKLSNHSI